MALTKTLKFDDDVMEVLRSFLEVTPENGHFLGRLTCGQLERKLYERVNKALAAMEGKWNRSAQAHIFHYDPREQLTGLLDTGALEVVKEGWFPTPEHIVSQMYDIAGYEGGLILEPSAGEGHIADVISRLIEEAGTGDKSSLRCVELNPNRAAILRSKGYVVAEGDFMDISPEEAQAKFARVFMNPPFENGQDIDHVRHAYSFLVDGGRLVSVMSEGPFFRTDQKAAGFREWMEEAGGYSVELPEMAFKESGTGVKTRLVIIQKPGEFHPDAISANKGNAMQVSLIQENFIKALALAGRAVAHRASLPVLSNVLLKAEPGGKFTVSATNLEIGITAWVQSKVEQAGSITVPAKLLTDLIASFPPERVDLALDEAGLTLNIRCGRHEANVKGIPAEEFPVVPVYAGGGFSLPAEELVQMLDQVTFAAARDEARPILTGCLLRLEEDKITLVAADGFRLARCCQNGKSGLGSADVIIPARSLVELAKVAKDAKTVDVLLQPERRQIIFHTEHVTMVSQLIEGKFPDFTQIIPKEHTTRTVVDRAGLLQAVKVSNLFARDSANIVKFEIRPGENELQNGKLTLVATSAELGDNVAELDAAIDGAGLDIAFNTVYLKEALEATDAVTVALETNEASSPGVVRGIGDDGWLCVVMPMNLSR